MESFELLEYPGKVVELVRNALDAAGIPISLIVTQGIVAGIALLLLLFVGKTAWRTPEPSVLRLSARIVFLGALAILLSVLVHWISSLANPVSGVLTGRVVGADVQQAEFQLMGYKDVVLPSRVDRDSQTNEFMISFEPKTADPPVALRVSAPGCESKRTPLGRRHLSRGEDLEFRIVCGQSQ